MIPRNKLQVLLYVLHIYYVFGDGDPGTENLHFLKNDNKTGVEIETIQDSFNHSNSIKIPSNKTEETAEFILAENTIPHSIRDEIKTNIIEDSGKEKVHKLKSSNFTNEIRTTSKESPLENRFDPQISVNKIRIIKTTRDSITLSWIVNSSFIPNYDIEWFSKNYSDYESKNSNLSIYTISGLKSCSNYTILITVSNEQQRLQNSLVPVVPGIVRNLRAEAFTNFVKISWSPPKEKFECVKSYLIEVFLIKNNYSSSIDRITTTDTFYEVKNLDPCSDYKFVVKAVGDAGSSEGFNTTVTTKLEKPGKPRNLYDEVVRESSLKIYWDPSEVGATCVKEYQVTLNTEIPKGSSGTTITKRTNKTEIIIENLFPCTSYMVQINAVDLENEDSDLERIINTNFTLPSVATAPEKDQIPTVTKDSIMLFWSIENDNNCTLESIHATCNYTGSKGEGYTFLNGTESSSTIIVDKRFRYLVNMTLSNLSPYTNYECTAVAINIAGKSQKSKIINVTTLEDLPSSPELNVVNVTDTKYTFDWIRPKYLPGKIRAYEISLSWEPLFVFPDWCSPTTSNTTIINGSLFNYTYGKGSPFSNYTVQIRAQTGAGWGNFSEPVQFISKIGLPSAVTNLTYTNEYSANDTNILNTILKWNLPCSLNGEVEFFNISFHGSRNNSEDHDLIQIYEITKEVNKDDVYYIEMGELRASYTYNFIVATKIKNSVELGATAQYKVEYPAGIPAQPEVEYVKAITIDPQKAIRTTTSAAILLPLFPVTNGNILYYAIMVSQMGYNDAISKRHDLKNMAWPNVSCWEEAMKADFLISYQATVPLWNPYPNHVVDYGHIQAVKFTLGEDINCREVSLNTDTRLYCNGPLKPDTWYHVRMRAFTDGGYADSIAFLVKTNAELNVPIVIGVVISIMILGILSTLFLLIRRYSLQAVLRRFLHNDLPGSPVPAPFTRKKFISHCQQLADNPGKLSNEFQLLQTLSLDLQMPTNVAYLQINRKKNRYCDILPYDFSRVKLDVIDNDPNTDYINASFITGYSGQDEYIACQGPKEETTYDFWRMIDQYDVKMIVMLTQFFEKGKEKCHQYFPIMKESFTYENMSIRCTSELDFRTYTQRTLVMQKDDKKRSIMHLHFKDWPDHDVPEDFDPMINFCQIMRRQITTNKGLMVIHCSAGIGRTGTLMAIDVLMQSIKDNRKLDVFGTVYRLRRHRLNMVQRESQYAYIYKCIRQVLKNPYFLKHYKPPPVELNHKNKRKKDSINPNLNLLDALDTWRKDSLSLSADSMEPMYESSPLSTLENPKNNGLRSSQSTSALDSKSQETCVVKSSSQGYVTYESVKDSSFGSSNLSLNVSDLQGSHKSIYENVPSLFRSRSDQLIDGNNSYMAKSNYYDPNREHLEEDTSL